MATVPAAPAISKTARPRPKPARHVRLLLAPNAEGTNGLLRITETRGRKTTTDEYFVDRVAAQFGTGFFVEKRDYGAPEASRYHVNLNGQHSSCECKGNLRWGHCRHVSALAALTEQGLL
jgi:hypothetical protein